MKRIHYIIHAVWCFAIAASMYYVESNMEGNMKTPLRHVPTRLTPGFVSLGYAFRWR